jgi:hypothetical protein
MTDPRTDDDAEGDEEWQFALDEVGPDGVIEQRESIEPGSPSLENVVFVLLGVALTVYLIWSVAAPGAG